MPPRPTRSGPPLWEKRCDASYVKGLYAPKSVYGWYVTFQTAHGKVLELSSPEECGGMKIGTTGILVVRGDKCEKFTPDQA